jgi:phosphatidylglycerol---prolipoprotein diacylglyceryl transferase
MFPVIDLGPLAIQAAGLILILSLWIGIWFATRLAMSIGTNGDVIENGFLAGLLLGILGARIGFLLQNPSIFLDNPLSLVSLSPSMLNPTFGILVAVLVILIAFQRKHLPLWPTMDTISPILILLFAGIHLANYADGNAYGLPTDLPWGIFLWNAYRHPVQLYAFILGLTVLIWWLIQSKWMKITGFIHSGVNFAITLSSLSAITAFTQAFVAEKSEFLNLDLIQLLAVMILAGGLVTIYFLQYHSRRQIPVYLSLGSNLNPEEELFQGSQDIAQHCKVLRCSGLYQTMDVREGHQNDVYLNRILLVETNLPFPELQNRLKSIERDHGRELGNKENIPLDIDIITYGSDVFRYEYKIIPDPNLIKFRYIALPLEEVSPGFRHPGTGESIQAILNKLNEQEQLVQKISEVEYGTKG